jgi:hypothetical protein
MNLKRFMEIPMFDRRSYTFRTISLGASVSQSLDTVAGCPAAKLVGA